MKLKLLFLFVLTTSMCFCYSVSAKRKKTRAEKKLFNIPTPPPPLNPLKKECFPSYAPKCRVTKLDFKNHNFLGKRHEYFKHLFFSRPKAKMKSLVKPRQNFRDKIKKSISQL